MNASIKTTLLPFLSVLALAAGAHAQCGQPDYLDGGSCCTRAQINLPTFPSFKQESLGLSWLDCTIDAKDNVTASWTAPTTPGGMPSNDYRSFLRIYDAGGSVIWKGRMHMTYSRTFEEGDPKNGVKYQVWRFLVNGDLRHSRAAAHSACPIPSCASAFKRFVRHTGYVDYALDCNTKTWSQAWMLTHACDKFEHIGGFARGGGFHPDRSSTFVGPRAGFVASAFTPVEAGMDKAEAVRSLIRPSLGMYSAIATSQFEETVTFQVMPTQQPQCACSPAGSAGQFSVADLFIDGDCGTTVNPSGQFLPGFVSMGIGTWTDPTVYPGKEALRWSMGEYSYFDPCTGKTRLEIFHGATTLGGYPARSILTSGQSISLPLTFIDQSNAMRKGKTSNNLPFISEHILNLNHK